MLQDVPDAFVGHRPTLPVVYHPATSSDDLLYSNTPPSQPMSQIQSFATPSTAAFVHETDAGPIPVERLPPQYENEWAPSSREPPTTRDGSSTSSPSYPSYPTSQISAPVDEKTQLRLISSNPDDVSVSGRTS